MNIKKIVFILLVFVFSMASFTAFSASSYDEAIDMVCSFGIMRGYEDGEFRPDGLLTRSEAVVTVSGIMGVMPDGTQNMFYDVPQSHWAKGYIEAAGKAGIVSGVAPGVFQPESNVTKYQAAIMLSNLMGYGEIVKADKKGETSYNAIIVSLGLYDGVAGALDEPISRGAFARMICNALEEPLLDGAIYRENDVSYEIKENVTILTRFLNVSKIKGQVTANSITGLTGGSTTKEGYVKIDNTLYNVGGTKIAEKMGRVLTVYYRVSESGEKTVVYYTPADRKSITVSGENIVSYVNNVFTYYESEDAQKTRSVNVLPVADCLYNGVYKIPQNQDFMPKDGSVELYDSDDDGIYDVAYIKSYTLYIADVLDYEKKCLTDKYNKSVLKLEKATQLNIYLDGRRIDFDEIKSGDVLLVAADKITYDNGYPLVNASAEVFEILVSRESLEGVVERKYDDFFTINDQKYEISNGMKYAITKGQTVNIGVGTEGIFFLDAFGKVVMAEKGQSLPAGLSYGYVIDCGTVDGEMGKQILALKVFDFNRKSNLVLYGADRMIIDGESKRTISEQLTAMKRQCNGNITTDFASRLITYKVNSKGLVNNIDTDYVSSAENSEETLSYDNNQALLRYSSKVFGGEIAVGDDTIVLAVPRTKLSTSVSNAETYGKRTFICKKDKGDYVYLMNSTSFSLKSKYPVESYNIKDNGEAPIIIYYYYLTENTNVIGNNSSKNMMIVDVCETILDDETLYEVTGFDGTKYTTLFLHPEDSMVADMAMNPDYTTISTPIAPMNLTRGDIVRYSELIKTQNTTLRIERVVSRENAFVPNFKHYAQKDSTSTDNSDEYFNAFNISCGKVVSFKNNILRVNFGAETKIYNLTDVPLCIYENDTVNKGEAYQLFPDTKVILVTTDGKAISCYIYK